MTFKAYNPLKPLISIHIPKCAGTSFDAILKGWFGAGFHRHYFDEKNNLKPKKIYADGAIPARPVRTCIHGHFNNKRQMGVFDYYPSADQYITIIRDPLELHISNYFFLKRRIRENQNYRNGSKQTLHYHNIDDYLENTNSFMLFHFPWELTQKNYEDILLAHFVHIGVLEKFQQSVDIIAQKLGVPPVPVHRKNTAPRDETPSDRAKEKWLERHPLERSIYRLVLRLND